MLYHTYNMNSAHTSDPVAKMQRMDKVFKIRRNPADFRLSWEKTEKGVKYLRMEKENTEKTGQLLLYFHGGAYISGLTSLYPKFLASLYEAMPGCEIIFLDYKKAPKVRYPYQLNEALHLWEELTVVQRYHPDQIALGGDSAGANLALAMLLKLRDKKKPMPKATFFLSAWGDLSGEGESFSKNYGKDILFGELGQEMTQERWEHIVNGKIFGFAEGKDRHNPYISPVYGSFHNFPPMCFTSGSEEMLLSDTLTIVEKAKEQGVEVECHIKEGMFHIFTVFARFCPEGMESLEKVKKFLMKHMK